MDANVFRQNSHVDTSFIQELNTYGSKSHTAALLDTDTAPCSFPPLLSEQR